MYFGCTSANGVDGVVGWGSGTEALWAPRLEKSLFPPSPEKGNDSE